MTAKQILCFFLCAISATVVYAKKKTQKLSSIYVVDSIPMITSDTTMYENTYIDLDSADIYSTVVVFNKEGLEASGYADKADTVIFITTTQFHNRPEEVKKIPGANSFYLKDNKHCLKSTNEPYTGRFINYSISGKSLEKGKMLNGSPDDTVIDYYDDGITKKSQVVFKDGAANGMASQYFMNGSLQATGKFINGRKNGYWVFWNSTGSIKRRMIYNDGMLEIPREDKAFAELFSKGHQYKLVKDFDHALPYFVDAIRERRNITEAYTERGEVEMLLAKYDDAINDFDTAIALEPYNSDAVVDRIKARVRKYTPDKKNNAMPAEDRDAVCTDLETIYQFQKIDRGISFQIISDKSPREIILMEMKHYCR